MSEKDSREISELTLEETFEIIDDLMDKLSDDEIPLEESFDLYKSGMEMLKHAGEVIDMVEKKVIELSGDE